VCVWEGTEICTSVSVCVRCAFCVCCACSLGICGGALLLMLLLSRRYSLYVRRARRLHGRHRTKLRWTDTIERRYDNAQPSAG